jgi:hypothetical protein
MGSESRYALIPVREPKNRIIPDAPSQITSALCDLHAMGLGCSFAASGQNRSSSSGTAGPEVANGIGWHWELASTVSGGQNSLLRLMRIKQQHKRPWSGASGGDHADDGRVRAAFLVSKRPNGTTRMGGPRGVPKLSCRCAASGQEAGDATGKPGAGNDLSEVPAAGHAACVGPAVSVLRRAGTRGKAGSEQQGRATQRVGPAD